MICVIKTESFYLEYYRKLSERSDIRWWGLNKLLFIGTEQEFLKFKNRKV